MNRFDLSEAIKKNHQELIAKHAKAIAEKDKIIAEKDRQIAERDAELAQLKAKLQGQAFLSTFAKDHNRSKTNG